MVVEAEMLRRAFALLNRAWKGFAAVGVRPSQLPTTNPVSSPKLRAVRQPQQQMSMYGRRGDRYHAAKAIQAIVSKETDDKLRQRLQKRRDEAESRTG